MGSHDRAAADPNSSRAESGQGYAGRSSDNSRGQAGSGRAEIGLDGGWPVPGPDRTAGDPNSGFAGIGQEHEGPVVRDREDWLITDPESGWPAAAPDRGRVEAEERTGLGETGEAGRLPEMFFQKVPGCHYPLGVILLSLQWVREGTSLRGVSRLWERWMVLL